MYPWGPCQSHVTCHTWISYHKIPPATTPPPHSPSIHVSSSWGSSTTHKALQWATLLQALWSSLDSQAVSPEATQFILQNQAEILEVLVTAYVFPC